MPPGRTVTAYPIRLSEAITLPRYLLGVRTVSTLFSLLPPRADSLFREQAERLSVGECSAPQAVLSLFEAFAAEPGEAMALSLAPPLVPIWVEAFGHQDGRRARYSCWPIGGWASTESILATAALKLLRGEIRAHGVLPPEAVFEPLAFFAEVAQSGARKLEPAGLLGELPTWCE